MLYVLLRDDGSIECEGDARDDDHALKVLGSKLNKTLGFDGPVGPAYILQVAKTNEVQWRSREGRGVYVIDDNLN
jgi:hypothetical protein